MNHLSANTLTPRELYSLLASQEKSYHKHYRMGSNSSVPTETARELMESIRNTYDKVMGEEPEEVEDEPEEIEEEPEDEPGEEIWLRHENPILGQCSPP